jgi:hypothetical protein
MNMTRKSVLKESANIFRRSPNIKVCLTFMSDAIDYYAQQFIGQDNTLYGAPVGEIMKLKRDLKSIFRQNYV